MRSLYIMYKQDDVTLEKYMESFMNSIDVVKHSDILIGEHPKLGTVPSRWMEMQPQQMQISLLMQW
eukprot:13365766-Ditylum_brightwellii.AAC.1